LRAVCQTADVCDAIVVPTGMLVPFQYQRINVYNVKRIRSYRREFMYVLKNSEDMRTRARLIKNLLLFHINNRFGLPRVTTPFHATVNICQHYKTELLLRAFTGDLFVFFEVMSMGAYSIPEAILPPYQVHVIVDCGANIGLTSLWFAAHYPNARIYSVEPDAQNFELLCLNTNAEPRITAIRAAVVGRSRRSAQLTSGMEAWRYRLVENCEGTEQNGEGTEVPAVTIEQILQEYKLTHIDLLKMDIEGAEGNVFRNGSFLDRVKFIIVELHGKYEHADFAADMTVHGLVAARAGTLPGVQMTTARRVLDSVA
jgi:FkbM family methyltransferase